MKRWQHSGSRLWDNLLVLIGVSCCMFPLSPANMPVTSRDSGAFLYIGWRILHGEVPYRDIWDHKPPVIFYINALGVLLSGDSRWGVWLIEYVALFGAALIGFQIISRAFGRIPAVFVLFVWLSSFVLVIQGGNFTTEYTLLLQFVVLWIIYRSSSGFSSAHLFWIGLLGAVAFFTKQTTIGIWIALLLYIIVEGLKSGALRQLFYRILSFGLGFLTVCVFWLFFFLSNGAFAQFYEAAFAYNFFYSAPADITERVNAALVGIRLLSITGLFQLALIGYIIGLVIALLKNTLADGWRPLLLVALIDLPIELLLLMTSGRSYAHYYMVILPVLAFFAGITCWIIVAAFTSLDHRRIERILVAISVVGVIILPVLAFYVNQASLSRISRDETAINYIKQHTSSDDYILIWGGESYVNFFAQRQSPTRFVYQFPLYTPGYANEAMILSFLEDIRRNRPRLIIDTYNPIAPIYAFPIQTEAVQISAADVRSRYCVVRQIDDWTVYEYTGRPCP